MTIHVTSNQPATQTTTPTTEGGKPQAEGGNPSAPVETTEQNETETSEVSETEGTETTEETESEETETETESEEETEKPVGDPKAKKKGGFQRRIDKLNAQKTRAQQETEYWKQQALKGASATKVDPTVETKAAVAEGKPDPAKFDNHADYIEALTDWKTDQKFRERDQKQQKEKLQIESMKTQESYYDRAKAFAKTNADFDEVMEDIASVPISPAVKEIIFTSENGPELAYELAKNVDEFTRICKLSPLAAAREMGKLESRIASSKSTKEKTETKTVTDAPNPLKPVGSGSKGGVRKSIDTPGLSQREYEAIRADQIKRSRARA